MTGPGQARARSPTKVPMILVDLLGWSEMEMNQHLGPLDWGFKDHHYALYYQRAGCSRDNVSMIWQDEMSWFRKEEDALAWVYALSYKVIPHQGWVRVTFSMLASYSGGKSLFSEYTKKKKKKGMEDKKREKESGKKAKFWKTRPQPPVSQLHTLWHTQDIWSGIITPYSP